MEPRNLRQYAIPPSDFLYYDPYYLLLKERSKSYPRVVEKFYNTKTVDSTKKSTPQEKPSDNAAQRFSSDDVVAGIVDDISSLMQSDLLSNGSDHARSAELNNLPDPTVIQALISTSITESSAFDPVLASRIRRLSGYMSAQDKLIADLKSQLKSYEKGNQMMADENKTRLESNSRAMNALYSDVDRYKAQLELADERLKKISPNLQSEFDELQSRYFVAMKIIDKMNWPSPDEDGGTVEYDEDNSN